MFWYVLNKTSFKFFWVFDLIHDNGRFCPLQKCFGYFWWHIKTSKMTESWLWICSKKLSVMQCVIRQYDITSFIFDKLLWKNLTKLRTEEKHYCRSFHKKKTKLSLPFYVMYKLSKKGFLLGKVFSCNNFWKQIHKKSWITKSWITPWNNVTATIPQSIFCQINGLLDWCATDCACAFQNFFQWIEQQYLGLKVW